MRDEALGSVGTSGTETAKRRAMHFMEKAFDDAGAEGLPVDAMAHAALFAALTTLVDCFGEEQVARMVADLPEKITSGSYSLNRILQ
jgi:hypothetical protein